MYEAGYGIAEPIRYNPEYRNNYFKVLVRVYGPIPDRVGAQKLIWINCAGGAPGFAPNGEPCPCANFYYEEPFAGDGTWDGTPQRIRVEWTRDAGARLLRNGA